MAHPELMGGELCTGFWWGETCTKETTLKDIDVDERVILKWILNEKGEMALTGCNWIRAIWACVKAVTNLLFFHKMWEISRPAGKLLSSEEGFYSMELTVVLLFLCLC
jgi:hypothetical protein